MLKFFVTTKNKRKINQKIRVIIAGKLLKNTRVKLLFAILPELHDASRAFFFPIGNQECIKREREEQSTVPE